MAKPAAKENEFSESGHPGLTSQIGLGFGALLPVGTIAWSLDLFRLAGLQLFEAQFYAAMLGLAFAAVFLLWPLHRTDRPFLELIVDLAAAATSLFACVYIAIFYPDLIDRIHEAPPDAIIAGTAILIASLEGIRRTSGLVLALVVLFFVLFALFGHLVPGELEGRAVHLDRLLGFVATDANAIFGLPMRVCTSIVIAFLLFGSLLSRSGGSDFFSDLAMSLFGRFRGGSAKIAVTASGLFGSISGSAVSNVLSTGVMTIPMMRRAGYPATSAGAIEAVASTGGQLMPPVMGAAAFLMAELLQVSYAEVIIAALVPALLYYAALFILVDLEAAKRGIKAVDAHTIPRVHTVLRAGWHFILPFAVIIVALFVFLVSPELSALYGCLALALGWLLIGHKGRRPRIADIWAVLAATARSSAHLLMICAGAGLIIGMLNISALGFALALALVAFGKGQLLLLLVLAAGVCIILGMGMPTVGVYILLGTLVAPALIELGVPQMAAHLFVLYYGMMSMTTPPVAIAAFAASTVAKTPPMQTAAVTTKYAWSAYVVPFLFVFGPSLLLEGDPFSIALAIATGLAGILLVSCAIVGYLFRPIDLPLRFVCAASGLALLLPAEAVAAGLYVNAAGAVLAIAAFGLNTISAQFSSK